MLTNQAGNVLVVHAINFSTRKILGTIYLDANHYNNGDSTFIKKASTTILIPTNFEYPKAEIKSDLSADEAILLYIEQIIIKIDSNWSTV